MYVVSIERTGHRHSKLLMSKSRVAPEKNLSIPRLELCAALLGCQLVNQILTTTEFQSKVIFWTDSTVVLQWIECPPSNWKIFVSNRIAEIQRLSDGHDWRYVPSESNPADHISRGMYPVDMLSSDMWWWCGPNYLTQETESWPKRPASIDNMTLVKSEMKTATVLLSSTEMALDIFDRFSDLAKLVKVVAWCIRFSNNCRLAKGFRTTEPLGVAEFENALKSLIRLAQEESFSVELKSLRKARGDDDISEDMNFKSLIKGLNVFLHEVNLLRVKGRLEKLSYWYQMSHSVTTQPSFNKVNCTFDSFPNYAWRSLVTSFHHASTLLADPRKRTC